MYVIRLVTCSVWWRITYDKMFYVWWLVCVGNMWWAVTFMYK